MTNLIRISKAAEILGVKRQRVYQMIEEGKIQVIDIDGIKFVDADKLSRDLLIRRKNQKPVKKVE